MRIARGVTQLAIREAYEPTRQFRGSLLQARPSVAGVRQFDPEADLPEL